MKTLPKKLQRLIKEERFSFDNRENQNWGGRMNIEYRITWIKLEDDWNNRSVYNPEWSTILVNLKVKGTASTGGYVNRGDNRNSDTQQDIKKLTRCKKTYWDGYESTYTRAWGYQSHKRIREEIRRKVINEIKDYLKLMGITGGRYGEPIKINTITFEK
jgi:hypothetical protein